MSEVESPEPSQLSPVELRRTARQVALQTLYAIDTDGVEFEQALQDGLKREAFTPELSDYIERVVRYFHENFEVIDGLVAPLLAKGWDMDRISKVDRAVLRLATTELLAIEEMPPKVTINEAVTLARDFGDKDSPRFINGVLGKLLPLTPKSEFDRSKFKSLLDEATALQQEEPDAETELVVEGSPAHEELMKAKGWILKSDS